MTHFGSVAYLGPKGTFADSAVAAMPGLSVDYAVAAKSISEAFHLVRRAEAEGAVVPIENSVEGSVSVTLDELNAGDPLRIASEVAVPVNFSLVAASALPLDQITGIGSHPHAEAQCRQWLINNVPGADLVPTMSTAGAGVALLDGTAVGYDAAIVPPGAVERYDVEVLAEAIADNQNAWTRFILVTLPRVLPEPTPADKTSLVLYIKANRAGALLEILTELALRGVNLTRIESRPTRKGLGDYCFSVDLEGHVAQARVADALKGLKRQCADVRFLGSYPKFGGAESAPPQGMSNEDYAAAESWLRSVVADS